MMNLIKKAKRTVFEVFYNFFEGIELAIIGSGPFQFVYHLLFINLLRFAPSFLFRAASAKTVAGKELFPYERIVVPVAVTGAAAAAPLSIALLLAFFGIITGAIAWLTDSILTGGISAVLLIAALFVSLLAPIFALLVNARRIFSLVKFLASLVFG